MTGQEDGVDATWSALPVPFAIEVPDRARKERYYDPDFFALEAEQLWSRVWQMACRLEEIPEVGDFTTYEILDQSIIVVRGDDGEVRAFQNVCRHRGVRLVAGQGNCGARFTCTFHGWCYGPDGANTRIPMRKSFDPHNLEAGDVDLTPVRCELWGSYAWINLDPDAPPLRQSIEPAATILDAWQVEELRTEWWYAARLPVNWKLAQQAFQEQYHVVQAHPQLVIPGMRYGAKGSAFDPRAFVDAEIQYLATMSEGMAGMVHAEDLRIAESLRDLPLPDDPDEAQALWYGALNDAVVEWHRGRGSVIPDLNELEASGLNEPMGYCFPHYFVLPMYSSASSYRFRPLGPEETLMEIWSLTRYSEDARRDRPTPPDVWECDDERWPPIPAQDFSNLPRQQLGLHARGFEYMRLSQGAEGHLSNLERTIDGFLAGLPHDRLAAALREVNVNPLVRPTVALDRQLMPVMQPDLSWLGVLEHHARRTPSKPIAVCGSRVVTYGEMATWSATVATGLARRGVGAGDVVGLLSYNSVEFLTTIYAANHLGAIAMPINWRLAADEVRFILDHSQARALVCDVDLVTLADAATAQIECSDLVRVCVTDEPLDGWERFDDVAAETDLVDRVAAAGDDPHRLMYTSGTTGRPKGVMISHANLAWKNHAHVAELGFTAADVGLACGPLYHVGALDLVTTSMISVGATTIIHRAFDATAVVEEVERSKVTCVWAAPAMLRAILDVGGIERRDLSSVQVIIAGGEKLPIPTIERLRATFPSAWLADAYGLTETVSGDTFLDRDSTITKLGSVGRPCQYLELEIWDEAGSALPPGERGEVVLRGPKVFTGYWRDPEATAKAFAGGWFHTGDIGVQDDDGFVFIVDRLKDMIVSGGENIASSEVERAIYEHPSVVEVAVVGRPDDRWGEVPIAFVVLDAAASSEPTTPAELIEHCRARLAKYKVPKDVVLIDALPRNPSGKVLKRDLRDRDSSREPRRG